MKTDYDNKNDNNISERYHENIHQQNRKEQLEKRLKNGKYDFEKMTVKEMNDQIYKAYLEYAKVPQEYWNILRQFKECFAQQLSEIGLVDRKLLEFEIHLKKEYNMETRKFEEARPYFATPYKKQDRDQQEHILKGTIDEVKNGISTEIFKPTMWNTVCLAVPKKVDKITGKITWRTVKDYTPLNAKTMRVNFPIPNIQKIIRQISTFKYFIALDIMSAYWHIAVKKEHRHYTVFSVGDRQFWSERMPFGTVNAPAYFAAMMKMVFKSILGEGWLFTYFDDITIGGNTSQELMGRLKRTLECCKEFNIKIKITKCEWEKEEINLLGWTISKGIVTIQKEKIKAITEWKWPTDKDLLWKKSLESFLGKINYLREFIPNISEKCKEIREVIRKKRPLKDQTAQKMFEEIKKQIIKEPHLHIIEFDKQMIIRTDASQHTIGGVLLQENDQSQLIPRMYYSKVLNDQEKRWSINKKEAYAIRKTLENFIDVLKIYQKHQVIVQTDNNDIYHTILRPEQPIDIEIANTLGWVKDTCAKIEFIEGRKNILADSLSRK